MSNQFSVADPDLFLSGSRPLKNPDPEPFSFSVILWFLFLIKPTVREKVMMHFLMAKSSFFYEIPNPARSGSATLYTTQRLFGLDPVTNNRLGDHLFSIENT